MKVLIMKISVCILGLLYFSTLSFFAQENSKLPESYNVVWNSQSNNSSESMPCGGGSIGLNVWVENDDILIYVSKSDAFDDNNGLNKLGRLRIRFSPNPFDGAAFKQELHLNDGYIKISAINGNKKTEIDIWVDVFRPVVHVDMESSNAKTVEAIYENWRSETFKERPGENFQNSFKWAPIDTIYTYKDHIDFQNNKIRFYHRNNEYTVFDANVKLQGLESVKGQLFNLFDVLFISGGNPLHFVGR